ncbi:hypothetical protein DID76_02285 [Candidatus Marinamargulisbacteria bacterium SCGC AG-414-C22]|nr:hypothetical protein DID76_02285 [Candidatus Marinamargulisbacteria bacterium SCGC AG-414-C22]
MNTFPLWILIAIFSSLFQCCRNSFQKALTPYFSDITVTWVRYFYGCPFVLLYYFEYSPAPFDLTWISETFLLFCLVGASCQVAASFYLIRCFSYQNFAVSITYAKLETICAAIIAALVFQDHVTVWGGMAIMVSVIGVLLASQSSQNYTMNVKVILNKADVRCGLACAFLYALSAVFFRQANLLIPSLDPIVRGINTVATISVIDTILFTIILMFWKPQELIQTVKHHKLSVLTGLFSVAASVLWIIALGITNAAYVIAVAQIDIIIAVVISKKIFKEKIKNTQLVGIALVICAVVSFVIV